MKVAVFGLGYVGSVTAACLAVNGHDVWGVDVDDAKVDPINAGLSPVVEPGLDELVAKAVAGGTLHATRRSASRRSTAPTCRWSASERRRRRERRHRPEPHPATPSEDIAAALPHVVPAPVSGFHSVVIRSTVPPGTVDDVVAPALAEAAAGALARSAPRCARSSSARAPASPTSSPRRSSWSAPTTRGRPSR